MEQMQPQMNMMYKIVQDNSEINQTEKDKKNYSIEVEDNVPEKKHMCDACGYECETQEHKANEHEL